MRTVDALIAARDFFTSNPRNWTHGLLADVRRGDGKACFCVLGAISLVTGCLKQDGTAAKGVTVSCIRGPVGARDCNDNYTPIGELSQEMLNLYASSGVELLAAANAIRYTDQATKTLYGDDLNAIAINDSANYGYFAVLRVLDTAIKNAKRRHINGGRYAAAA